MGFYFDRFENRRPPPPLEHSITRELIWQFLATMNLVVGAWYIIWRWGHSLNPDALWFAIPVATAETGAYIGLCLFTFNLWKVRDYPRRPPPRDISDCDPSLPSKPVSVDVFIATYSEDPELVRLSIRDSKRIRYPHPIDLTVHVLDDGRRDAMRIVAEEEGANYISRSDNIGFKAGNLRNAMERTSGDFIVICDADTRPFPTILEHTMGYFRDPDVAWVQTPQWFYDLPEGTPLPDTLKRRFGRPGSMLGRLLERVVGPVRVGADPFDNDPQMFYDIIQRRRNWANAAFCCGAGSIHRREAVMQAALRAYGEQIDHEVTRYSSQVEDIESRTALEEAMRREAVIDTEFTPYKFHVSEDIYTSMLLHSDMERRWKSVLHPEVESKMLSPQDLHAWMVQRFKYAGGTLDIARNDNPIFRPGLTPPQRLMYATTIWSYFGCLWNIVFLAAPVLYLFTGISPVAAWSFDFFKHFLPFIILNELASMAGMWGVANFKGKSNYIAFFSVNFRALMTVLRGEKIKFPVTPKERANGTFGRLVIPQIAVIALTLLGIVYATARMAVTGDHGDVNALIANIFWGLNNCIAVSVLVRAAFWRPDPEDAPDHAPTNELHPDPEPALP
jgi:cellulose synthase (UDP-forming)